MKKLFLLLVFVGNLFFSCDEIADKSSFDFGVIAHFVYGNEYCSANDSIVFSITAINDSRCPSDVVCVWQGEAVVAISVISPQEETIELSTYDNLVDTVGNYSFELMEVSPYPISTEVIELEDYVVSLKIEKL